MDGPTWIYKLLAEEHFAVCNFPASVNAPGLSISFALFSINSLMSLNHAVGEDPRQILRLGREAPSKLPVWGRGPRYGSALAHRQPT
jgi:hypothetical protein